MKKLLVFLMIALLALTTCHAEDMEIMNWASPTPAPTPEPTPTPSPTPASYANFQDIVVEPSGYAFEDVSLHAIDILAMRAAGDMEDIRFSWTDQAVNLDESGEWETIPAQVAESGITAYFFVADSYSTGICVLLPDNPELEGDQWVNFRVGDERVSVNFRLIYLGDYWKGENWESEGWELGDWSFTVSRVVGQAEDVAEAVEGAAEAVEGAAVEAVELQTEEIQDSWEEILAAIDDGTAEQRYAVGAWKELALDGIGTINMQLAGFNLDTLSDGTGKAPTTWIAKELLPEKRRMNPEYSSSKAGTGSIDGWERCELRSYLHIFVQQAFPEVVRDRLQWVKKTQDAYDINKNLFTQTTSDNLWIPSYEEVFGEDSLYYELFHNSAEKRVKTLDQRWPTAYWWLRSANGYSGFSSVHTSGVYGSSSAGSAYGVALGFCL